MNKLICLLVYGFCHYVNVRGFLPAPGLRPCKSDGTSDGMICAQVITTFCRDRTCTRCCKNPNSCQPSKRLRFRKTNGLCIGPALKRCVSDGTSYGKICLQVLTKFCRDRNCKRCCINKNSCQPSKKYRFQEKNGICTAPTKPTACPKINCLISPCHPSVNKCKKNEKCVEDCPCIATCKPLPQPTVCPKINCLISPCHPSVNKCKKNEKCVEDCPCIATCKPLPTIYPPPVPTICPKPVHCKQNPCNLIDCQPGSTCVPNYCNGKCEGDCTAVPQPIVCPKINCLISPCDPSVNKCKKNEKCVEDCPCIATCKPLPQPTVCPKINCLISPCHPSVNKCNKNEKCVEDCPCIATCEPLDSLPACKSDGSSDGWICGQAITKFCDAGCNCCQNPNTCNPFPLLYVKTFSQCSMTGF